MRRTAAPRSSLDALDQWGIQFPLLPEDPDGLVLPKSPSLARAISSWRLSIPTLLPRRGATLDQWGIEFPIPIDQLAAFAQNRRSGCLEARTSVLAGRLRGISQAGAWAAILAVVVAGSALAVDAPASAGAAPPHGAPAGGLSAAGSPVVIVEADSAQMASLPSITEEPLATSIPTPGPTPGGSLTGQPSPIPSPTPGPTPSATLPAQAIATRSPSYPPAPSVLVASPSAAAVLAVPTVQDARNYLVARLGAGVDRHWGRSQSQCASLVFEYEARWDPHATNKRSGAYGLPQAYPASKLANWAEAKAAAAAKAGDPDAAWLYRAWRDNPVVQAEWGIDYMTERYGSPCGALAFRSERGWY